MDYSLTTLTPVRFKRYITIPTTIHDYVGLINYLMDTIKTAGHLAFTRYIGNRGHRIYVYHTHRVNVRIIQKDKPIPDDIQEVISFGREYTIRYG